MTNTDVLINLNDPRTKEIAEVITNKTSKKVLQELTKENMSVSEISQNLKLPLNTVDYNIKKLTKAGLIERRSFFWSPKGRKMHVYGIVNKRIIINPSSLGGKKAYLFTFLATGLIALGAKTWQYLFSSTARVKTFAESSDLIYNAAPQMTEAASGASKAVETCANLVAGDGGCVVDSTSIGLHFTPGPIGWFLIGAWLAIILVIGASFLRDWKKR